MATKKKAPSDREIVDPIVRELAIQWVCVNKRKERAAAIEQLDWLAKRGGDAEFNAMIDRMTNMSLGLRELITREAWSKPDKSVISKEWTLVERLWVISAATLGMVRYLAMGGAVGTEVTTMDIMLLIVGGTAEQLEATRTQFDLIVQMAGDEGFPGRGGEALRLHYIAACATLLRDRIRAGEAYGSPGLPTVDTFHMLSSGTITQVNAAREELDEYVERARAVHPAGIATLPIAAPVLNDFVMAGADTPPANDVIANEVLDAWERHFATGTHAVAGAPADGSEPTWKPCGHGGPGTYCPTLRDRLNPDPNHGKGLSQTVVTRLDAAGDQRVVGVAYRTHTKDQGTMINVCPFCGHSLVWFHDKAPALLPPIASKSS